MTEKTIFTICEAANYLGCSEITIRRMIRDRILKASKPRGTWLIRLEDIDACLENTSIDLIKIAQV